MQTELPHPQLYFPVSKNAFSFQTGLKTLAKNDKVIQIDSEYHRYFQNKRTKKGVCYHQFVQRKKLKPEIEKATCKYLIDTLLKNYPDFFSQTVHLNEIHLTNNITMETLKFNLNYDFLSSTKHEYQDAMDALVSQMQEDMSIVTLDDDSDKICYLHLCAPNFWSAEEKIGKSFSNAHQSVPGMDKINRQHRSLNSLLSNSGPFERFTWGLTSNINLSQHPNETITDSRNLIDATTIYLRIERQVTAPFEKYNAYLFFIRTYFRRLQSLNPDEKGRLANSLNTMPDDIAEYKGISQQVIQIIDRIRKEV